jgi:hypothetical protein
MLIDLQKEWKMLRRINLDEGLAAAKKAAEKHKPTFVVSRINEETVLEVVFCDTSEDVACAQAELSSKPGRVEVHARFRSGAKLSN